MVKKITTINLDADNLEFFQKNDNIKLSPLVNDMIRKIRTNKFLIRNKKIYANIHDDQDSINNYINLINQFKKFLIRKLKKQNGKKTNNK